MYTQSSFNNLLAHEMVIVMTNEDYLRQQLEWVAWRIETLDKIDVKLKEMKALAEYARDNNLNQVQTQLVNDKLQVLQKEVTELDEQSKVCWLDCQ